MPAGKSFAMFSRKLHQAKMFDSTLNTLLTQFKEAFETLKKDGKLVQTE